MNIVNIYLASSWRNPYYEDVLQILNDYGFNVYDFKNPDVAFDWREILGQSRQITSDELLSAYKNPKVIKAFNADKDAMDAAGICILLLPAGSSAHMEAGYMKGQNKPLIIYAPQAQQPETLHLMANQIFTDIDVLAAYLRLL